MQNRSQENKIRGEEIFASITRYDELADHQFHHHPSVNDRAIASISKPLPQESTAAWNLIKSYVIGERRTRTPLMWNIMPVNVRANVKLRIMISRWKTTGCVISCATSKPSLSEESIICLVECEINFLREKKYFLFLCCFVCSIGQAKNERKRK